MEPRQETAAQARNLSPLFLASVQITEYFRISRCKRNYYSSVTPLVFFPPLPRKYIGLTAMLIERQQMH